MPWSGQPGVHSVGWYGCGVSELSCAETGRHRRSPFGPVVLHPPHMFRIARGPLLAMTATTKTMVRTARTRTVLSFTEPSLEGPSAERRRSPGGTGPPSPARSGLRGVTLSGHARLVA